MWVLEEVKHNRSTDYGLVTCGDAAGQMQALTRIASVLRQHAQGFITDGEVCPAVASALLGLAVKPAN